MIALVNSWKQNSFDKHIFEEHFQKNGIIDIYEYGTDFNAFPPDCHLFIHLNANSRFSKYVKKLMKNRKDIKFEIAFTDPVWYRYSLQLPNVFDVGIIFLILFFMLGLKRLVTELPLRKFERNLVKNGNIYKSYISFELAAFVGDTNPNLFQYLPKKMPVSSEKLEVENFFAHVGSLYFPRSVKPIIFAARNNPNETFLLVGKIDKYNTKLLRKKPDNLIIKGEVKSDVAQKYMHGAKGLIVIDIYFGSKTQPYMPSKVYDYMSFTKNIHAFSESKTAPIWKFEEEFLVTNNLITFSESFNGGK